MQTTQYSALWNVVGAARVECDRISIAEYTVRGDGDLTRMSQPLPFCPLFSTLRAVFYRLILAIKVRYPKVFDYGKNGFHSSVKCEQRIMGLNWISFVTSFVSNKLLH